MRTAQVTVAAVTRPQMDGFDAMASSTSGGDDKVVAFPKTAAERAALRKARQDMPDPLKMLYDFRPELIARVTGRPVTRVLRFLYADAHTSVSNAERAAVTASYFPAQN